MTDPIEDIIAKALDGRSIEYQRPQHGLDFTLSNGTQIECKQFYTERVTRQLAANPEVILIQGRQAAYTFAELLKDITLLAERDALRSALLRIEEITTDVPASEDAEPALANIYNECVGVLSNWPVPAEYKTLLAERDALRAEVAALVADTDEGASKALALLAKALGVTEWEGGDGTETWDGDVAVEISNILKAADVYEDEEGVIATHAALATARAEGGRAGQEAAAKWHDSRAAKERACGSVTGARAEEYAASEIRALAPTLAPTPQEPSK